MPTRILLADDHLIARHGPRGPLERPSTEGCARWGRSLIVAGRGRGVATGRPRLPGAGLASGRPAAPRGRHASPPLSSQGGSGATAAARLGELARRPGVVVALLILVSLTPWAAHAQTPPALPLAFLDTTYSPPASGATWNPDPAVTDPNDPASLQYALNASQPGDIVQLRAGATFTGTFALPNQPGTGWIYVQSSAYASLPPPGSRVSPGHASLMPRLVSADSISPVITTAAGAHHYRFVGIEITTTLSVTTATAYDLVFLEAAGGQTSLTQVPTDIVFDRCYIHGTPTGNVRRGIRLNSARTAVVDSWLSDFHAVDSASQAISGWNGPGPFKIVNNHLEGATENVMIGGADPSVQDLVPSDIEVRHNHFFKPVSWCTGQPMSWCTGTGPHWPVENLLEVNNGQRVLIEGNVLEYNWADAVRGFAVLFTPRNNDGTAPWSIVRDVTFRLNIVRHSASGVNISGADDERVGVPSTAPQSQETARILVQDNFFDDLGPDWGGDGRIFQVVNGPWDALPGFAVLGLTIEHNTARVATAGNSAAAFFGDSPRPENQHQNFSYRNNVTERGQEGVVGTDRSEGAPTLDAYCATPYAFTNNVIIGVPGGSYPGVNWFPPTDADVGFVDYSHGNYALGPGSPYKNQGTDGKDPGADFDALGQATAGVTS